MLKLFAAPKSGLLALLSPPATNGIQERTPALYSENIISRTHTCLSSVASGLKLKSDLLWSFLISESLTLLPCFFSGKKATRETGNDQRRFPLSHLITFYQQFYNGFLNGNYFQYKKAIVTRSR